MVFQDTLIFLYAILLIPGKKGFLFLILNHYYDVQFVVSYS